MKFKIFFLVFILLLPNISFAACKYTSQIAKCDSAIKSFTGKDKKSMIPGDSIKSIEDFPCLQASLERRVYQIAMDQNFKEIDEELEKNLAALYKAKDFYFGKDSNYTYYDGVDYIKKKKNYYKNKYQEACQKSLEESTECLKNIAYNPAQKSISVLGATKFLQGGDGECYDLLNLKVNIFADIASNGLLLNKEQVSKDQKKTYQQNQRKKYDKVLDAIMLNLSYLERIWKGWPSKTKNPL